MPHAKEERKWGSREAPMGCMMWCQIAEVVSRVKTGEKSEARGVTEDRKSGKKFISVKERGRLFC